MKLRKVSEIVLSFGITVVFVLVTFGIAMTIGKASAAAKNSVNITSTDGSLKGAIVTINGREYDCIKYSTVNRGGVWCEALYD